MARRLSWATGVVMVIATCGFWMWYKRCDPWLFDYISKGCFLWVLYIILDEGGIHAGITEAFRNCFGLCRDALQGMAFAKKEAK